MVWNGRSTFLIPFLDRLSIEVLAAAPTPKAHETGKTMFTAFPQIDSDLKQQFGQWSSSLFY